MLQRLRKWFRGPIKEDVNFGGFGLVPDPGLGNQNWFRQWVGIYQLVDRMARARGGNLVEQPQNDRMLYIARGLMRFNPYAQGFINTLRTHTLGANGLQHQATGPSAKAVQEYLEKFKDKTDWWSWEREIYDRVHIEGNSITRFYPRDDYVDVRPIEPEWVIPKDGTEEWTFGYYNEPGDICNVTAVHVLYGREDEIVDGNEFYHIKSKLSVRADKVGNSDFLGTASLLDDSFKTWRNFAMSEAVRQSIVYFAKQPDGVTADDLSQSIAQQADYAPPSSIGGRPAGTPIALQYGSAVEYLPPGTDLAAPPAAASIQSTMTGVNATLLAAGRAYSMPLVMMSGDMSANNTLDFSDDSPFGMAITDEQRWFCRHVHCLLWRVVEIGVEEGWLPERVLEDGTGLNVTAQKRQTSSATDNTQRAKTLFDDGIISARERSVMEGVDYDAQQEERKKEGLKSPKEMADAAEEAAGESKKGGLVKKKIAVHRGGKTYYESRAVRSK